MINLSNKERILLEDAKHHEELCIQKYSDYINQTQNTNLKTVLNGNLEGEKQHLNTINEMLSGQIPSIVNDMNGQGGNNKSPNSINAANASTNSVGNNYNQQDAKICNDLLCTEKFVSSTYDTTIFELMNKDFRNALNHIQKEEQEHGENLFNYMYNNGMYNVQ